ncbi:MAG: FAD binding domain-containing protein [Deltaproteobacteria bacterium]|nr:FAD binding domain-containing protein [Deltaproteobacteria bacterium]
MRLPAFDYISPENLKELLALKQDLGPAAAVLAGGTDLVVRLKKGLVKPQAVLSLKRVEELNRLEADPVHLTIGAGVVLSRILADETVRQEFPGLIEALARIGHPTCQHHSATLGGNLLLEPRCLYYNQSAFWRQGHERCFKAGGQVCLINPESKECSSANQSDGAPMLIASSALVKLASAQGERLIPAARLFSGKGEEPHTLGPGEILVEIKLPRPAGQTGAAYEKLAFRSALDFPLVSAAAVVGLGRDKVERARLVLGGVSPAPLLVEEADQILRGQAPSQDLVRQAATAAQSLAAGQMVDNTGATDDYRRQMVRVVAQRALERALGL